VDCGLWTVWGDVVFEQQQEQEQEQEQEIKRLID
jgi:hypothetical protein